MAFGKVTAADLKEAGLDPEEFKKLIGSSATKEELTTMKTSLTTDITSTLTQTIKDEMASLETRLRSTPDKSNQNQNQNQLQNELTPEDFISDPVAATRKIANESAAAVLGEQRKMAASYAYEKAQSFPYMGIVAIKEEVDNEWKKFNPIMMATPDILIRNIYDMVVGRHTVEIQQDTAKKEGKYNLVATGGGGSSTINPGSSIRKPEELLTPEELKQAAMFGKTPAEWAEAKGKLRYV